jgi:hypothetical protein
MLYCIFDTLAENVTAAALDDIHALTPDDACFAGKADNGYDAHKP